MSKNERKEGNVKEVKRNRNRREVRNRSRKGEEEKMMNVE